MATKMTFEPVTPDRWSDFEHLFGERGACGGCWCMFWRLTRSEFNEKKGPGNKRAMKKIVTNGEEPGILGYADGRPVGWCAVAPREVFTSLSRSRVLKPVDDQPVWSIVCFFVDKTYRRQKMSVALIKAAVKFARERGAKIVEGYPAQPRSGAWPDAFAYMGLPSAFEQAGFEEVLRRSPGRPIMRRYLQRRRKSTP